MRYPGKLVETNVLERTANSFFRELSSSSFENQVEGPPGHVEFLRPVPAATPSGARQVSGSIPRTTAHRRAWILLPKLGWRDPGGTANYLPRLRPGWRLPRTQGVPACGPSQSVHVHRDASGGTVTCARHARKGCGRLNPRSWAQHDTVLQVHCQLLTVAVARSRRRRV